MRLQSNFQFILRLLNTNVDGKQKVVYALTKIKGVGRRYSNLVCKKADVDLNKRAGELTCTISHPHEASNATPKWNQTKLLTLTQQPKSSSVSSPSSRTPLNTRSPAVRRIYTSNSQSPLNVEQAIAWHDKQREEKRKRTMC